LNKEIDFQFLLDKGYEEVGMKTDFLKFKIFKK